MGHDWLIGVLLFIAMCKWDGGYSKMIQSNGSGAIARPLEIRALREIRLFGFLLNALIFDSAKINQRYAPGSKFAPGAYFSTIAKCYR